MLETVIVEDCQEEKLAEFEYTSITSFHATSAKLFYWTFGWSLRVYRDKRQTVFDSIFFSLFSWHIKHLSYIVSLVSVLYFSGI